MIRPTRMRIPSYTPIDMEQYVGYWREGLAEDRRNRANERVLAEATAAASIDADWGNTIMERHYHEPECECSVCRTNDQLGYDADVSDPSQYCRHGTFIGSWWGPDYTCGACESGYEPTDGYLEWRNRKRRIAAIKPRTRIGASTLRGIAAYMIERLRLEDAAKDAWNKRTQDMTDGQIHRLNENKELGITQRLAAFWAFDSLLTQDQLDWLRQVMGNVERKKDRESFERLIAGIRIHIETSPDSREAKSPELVERAIERYTEGYRDQLPRKDDPLRYYRPNTDPRAAFERLDAIQAWTKGNL
jgi:hypothetical protein